MSFEEHEGCFVWRCDKCRIEAVFPPGNFWAALAELKSRGWQITRLDDWVHRCANVYDGGKGVSGMRFHDDRFTDPKLVTEVPTAIPDDVPLEDIANDVVRGKLKLTPPQMRLLIELLPYYRPKLTAVAHYQGSFAEALEREIEKRVNRPPPSKLIEGRAVEVQSAEVLNRPFARLRRRI